MSQAGTARDAALLLLKDLVENQFPCFIGSEADLFDLVFKLREDPSRSVSHNSLLHLVVLTLYSIVCCGNRSGRPLIHLPSRATLRPRRPHARPLWLSLIRFDCVFS